MNEGTIVVHTRDSRNHQKIDESELTSEQWELLNSNRFTEFVSLYPQYEVVLSNSRATQASKLATPAATPAADTQDYSMLPELFKLFYHAKDKGKVSSKKLSLTIGKFSYSLAPDTGKNPGFIYVKKEGNYIGKVSPFDGMFYPTSFEYERYKMDIIIAVNKPEQEIISHGKATGECSCCGRLLTNPESIQAGIGPICAGKWGFNDDMFTTDMLEKL